MSNFIAIDVETANADFASICSIGLVQFRGSEVVKRLGILVNPEDHFSAMNVAIHGITPDMVEHSPKMRDVYPMIATALAGCVVVHHSPFDRVALRRAGVKYGHAEIVCTWLDTARVARRSWERVAEFGYGLANLALELGIALNHHDATEDAHAAGQVLLRAIHDTGRSLDDWIVRAYQPLTDKRVHRPRLDGNPEGPLAGETIAFTGALEIPRHEAAKLAAAAGCDVGSGVTKATTILVIGDQDVRLLKGADKSDKHRKAEQMILAGATLRIIGETDFRLMVGG